MEIVFWLAAILISLAAGLWVFSADKKRAVPYPWLTSLLRTCIVFLTFLLLLAPLITLHKNETQKPIILFLQDNTASVANALKKDSTVYRKDAEALLQKLEKDYQVVKWGFGATIQKDSLFLYTQPATNISYALDEAVEYYGQQNLGAIILATDGRFNEGLNPLFQELPYQGTLYSVAIGDSALQKDIRVTNVYANKTVALHSQFEIRADILADRCEGYSNDISIREANGDRIAQTPLNITSSNFDKTVSFTIQAVRTGLHHYIIEVPAASGELNIANNRKDVFVEVVSEKKNILVLAAAPHPDVNAIREALEGLENYTVTVKISDHIPSDLFAYQIVILHDLPVTNESVDFKKPVWYIVGSGSNPVALGKAQIAAMNINSLSLQNNFAQFNPSFNAFTLPQNLNEVLDKMPPLASPAGKIMASPNSLVLLSSKNNNQPMWLLHQGNIPSAMLIGEGLWRWRMYEYRYFNSHAVIDDMVRQTISFLAANVNENPFRVTLPKYIWSNRESINLNAYLLNASNEQVNTSDVQLTITDSAGNKQSFSFEKMGNVYKINIGTRTSGVYNYLAQTVYNGKSYTSSGSFTIHNMPIEMMQTGADYSLLYSLAKKYDGALIPSENIRSLYDSILLNKSIKPVIQAKEDTIPLVDWKWYFFLILLFAIIEWILRKYWMAQ